MPSSLWWIKYVIFSPSSLLEAELKLLAYKCFEQSELALILNLKTWSLFLFMVLCILSCYLKSRTLFREHMEMPHEESRLWNSRERERSLATSADASLPDIYHLIRYPLLLRCPVPGVPTDTTRNNYTLSNASHNQKWHFSVKNDGFCATTQCWSGLLGSKLELPCQKQGVLWQCLR